MPEFYRSIDRVGGDERVGAPEDWRAAPTIEDAIDDPPPSRDTTLRDPSLRARVCSAGGVR